MPVPPVTERAIFPPVPAPDEAEFILALMLPPVVETAIAPPFPD
ncbi:hypothetical protein QUB60_25125 [Microcoleus sp. A2-C5]